MRFADSESGLDNNHDSAASPPLHAVFWRERLVLLALLLLGTALRLPGIGSVPPGLYHDEAQNGLDALSVLTGRFPLYFEANNGREPLFIYLVAFAVGVLGRTPMAVRIPSFFTGVLTLATTYALTQTLLGRRSGKWALAVMAVTFWHVHLSRVAFRAVLLPLLTASYLWQGAKGVRSGRAGHWLAAGVLYGASWYTYMAARFTPIALAAVLIYGLWYDRRQLLKALRGASLAAAAALLTLLPLGLYTLAHPTVVLARSGQVSVFSEHIHSGRFWPTLARHARDTAAMFVVRGDRIWRHNLSLRPVWDPALGLAFLVGLGLTLVRFRRDPPVAVILLWTTVMTLPTLLAEDAPHFLRGVGVLPTAALIPALGLRWLSRGLHRVGRGRLSPASRWGRLGVRALPLLLLIGGLSSTVIDYFFRYPSSSLTHHWFEAGPANLAEQLNFARNQGWDGARMRHGADQELRIFLDQQLWDEWESIPFLVPESAVAFLPVQEGTGVDGPVHFAVWPYRDWEPDVLPYLPRPAYLHISRGPAAQGDLDPAPFTIAMLVSASTVPPVPDPIARFENGILLRAALVRVDDRSSVTALLWWETTIPINYDYTVFVHYQRNGERIAQDERQPGFGHLRTTFWQPGDLILDEHPLPGVERVLADDTLRLGFYDPETGEGLARLDAAGHPIADAFEIPVIVTNP